MAMTRAGATGSPSAHDRPILLTNGRIITLDGSSSVHQALLISGTRIVASGSTVDMRAAADGAATEIDLQGRSVIPGLIDSHAHMDREGLKSMGPSLAGCRTVDDVLQRVEAAVQAAPPGEWIVTMPLGDPPYYWNGEESALREGRFPNRHELDRVSPRNPVYIRPVWGYWRHAPNPEVLISVANSLALAATKIGRDTIPPSPSISLERDPRSGELTGVFVERTRSPIAELLMLSKASRFSPEQRQLGIRRAMSVYNAFGTTGVFEGHGVAAEVFRAFKACAREADLSVRARLVHSPSWGVANVDFAQLATQWAYWTASGGLGDAFLSLDGFFIDSRPAAEDVLRARAAPYTGWAGHNYDSSLPLAQLKPVLLAAAQQDMRCVALNSAMIDVFAEVDREVPLAGRRWAVQHFSTLTQAQCETAARLGLVLAPMTPRHIYKEGKPQEKAGTSAAAADHLPLRRLMQMGVRMTLASDNAPPSLFHCYWHAVARRNRHGELVHPEAERLSREQALRAACENGAYLTFEERERGTLEAGKLADVAVPSEDPLTCDEDRLPETRSLLTMVDGRIVHQDAELLDRR